MRNDLQFLEQADAYLTGKLSSSDMQTFEKLIRDNNELKEQFETQKEIIQAAKRKALLQEITAVGATIGGSSWIAANAKWILSALVIGAVSTAVMMIIPENQESVAVQKHEPTGDSISHFKANEVYQSVAITEKNKLPEGIKQKTITKNQYSGTQAYINSMSFMPNFREFTVFQSSQNEVLHEENSSVENKVSDEMVEGKYYNRKAQFPKGNIALKNFIAANLIYPNSAATDYIEANVQVDFYVGEDGKIYEVNAQCFNLSKSHGEFSKPYNSFQMFFNKKIAKSFEEEALRLMKMMPIWEYATDKRGNALVSPQRLYFDFNYPAPTLVYQLEEMAVEKEKGKGWKYQ